LYGHGSGTLFKEDDLSKNIPDLLSPGRIVKNCYKEGETFDGKFGIFGQAFEECRAECTATYLILHKEVLEIFNVDPSLHKKYMLGDIYSMIRSGMVGLLDYSPADLHWRQAHSQGRFAILKACLIWGKGALKIKRVDTENKFEINIDENRLDDILDACTIMLKHLNYYKATGQVEPAAAFFQSLTSVDPFFLEVRESSLKLKRREVVFQGALSVKNGNEYDLTDASSICEGEPTVFDSSLTLIKNIQMATNPQ